MSCVKKAVVLAAGIGNRMRPVTLVTPKPLVKVNGRRMIDTVVEALHINGIFEIYVVVGYKKEQFYAWAKENHGIEILENDFYDTCNNISSLYVARDFLQDSMILDGDQIIYNPRILNPAITKSGYCCAWTERQTDEWLLRTDETGRVISCSRTGGAVGWQLFGISRWTKADGEKLKHCLEEQFESKKNTQIYWDDIPLFCYSKDFDLSVYPVSNSDVLEIDAYSELCQADGSYRTL